MMAATSILGHPRAFRCLQKVSRGGWVGLGSRDLDRGGDGCTPIIPEKVCVSLGSGCWWVSLGLLAPEIRPSLVTSCPREVVVIVPDVDVNGRDGIAAELKFRRPAVLTTRLVALESSGERSSIACSCLNCRASRRTGLPGPVEAWLWAVGSIGKMFCRRPLSEVNASTHLTTCFSAQKWERVSTSSSARPLALTLQMWAPAESPWPGQ